jgi:hypothetical protein
MTKPRPPCWKSEERGAYVDDSVGLAVCQVMLPMTISVARGQVRVVVTTSLYLRDDVVTCSSLDWPVMIVEQ